MNDKEKTPVTLDQWLKTLEKVDIEPFGVDLNQVTLAVENRLIKRAFNAVGQSPARAAKFLGINRTTLVERLKKRGGLAHL